MKKKIVGETTTIKRNHSHQNTESPLQTQQSKEDEEAEKYPAGKGT